VCKFSVVDANVMTGDSAKRNDVRKEIHKYVYQQNLKKIV